MVNISLLAADPYHMPPIAFSYLISHSWILITILFSIYYIPGTISVPYPLEGDSLVAKTHEERGTFSAVLVRLLYLLEQRLSSHFFIC